MSTPANPDLDPSSGPVWNQGGLKSDADGCALMKRRSVTVSDGFDGVNRIAMLLRQRGYSVVSFGARMTTEPTVWTVECICLLTPNEDELLVKRLNRLPSVLKVFREASCGEFPHASGANAVAAG